MEYESCAEYVKSMLRPDLQEPEVMIICGSGLSGLSANFTSSQTINYSDIPGFPQATVPGHHGELVFGHLGSIRCVCMRGRFHFYEGNSMESVVFPVHVARCMGAKLLIVTNAAGGLNPEYSVGDIVVIQDHFGLPCLAGNHPLRGQNDPLLGPRFYATSDAYDSRLQDIVLEASRSLNLQKFVRSNGIYCYVSGPSYESKVECRFLRSIGGDAVGALISSEIVMISPC